MGKTYSHLSAEERAAIMIEQSRQTSCRGIARLLGRSVSTVSRELSRNKAERGEAYDATAATEGYRARLEPSKLVESLSFTNASAISSSIGAGHRSR